MGRFSPLPSLQALAHLLLVRPVLKVFFGASVVGKENLEGLEQFILVANHNSHLDTPLLFHILPLRLIPRTHPVGALDHFGKTKILFRVAEFLFQPVWIVRGAKGAGSLEGMRERLRAGHSVIIFPEGTRGVPGELARFRGGVGLLGSGVPGGPHRPGVSVGGGKSPSQVQLPSSPDLDPDHRGVYLSCSEVGAKTSRRRWKAWSGSCRRPRERGVTDGRSDPGRYPPSRSLESTAPGRAPSPGPSLGAFPKPGGFVF